MSRQLRAAMRYLKSQIPMMAGVMLASSLMLPLEAGEPLAQEVDHPFRVAFSARMFTGVNENDARAAVKVWSITLGQEQGIPVDSETRILSGANVIATAVQNNEIDCITLTTDEYWSFRKQVLLGPFVMGLKRGLITEEYLVLVRADSSLKQIGDLRGRSLAIFENPRTCLAPFWLDTLLLKNGLNRAEKFCGKVVRMNKLNNVVLPVYFKQTDACLVTRDGFQTMTELNPQIGKQLKIIAQSPPFVPSVFCFRGNYTSKNRDKLRASIGNVHKSVAGKQTITLFQSESLVERPVTALDSACELLDTYQQLCRMTNSTQTSTSNEQRSETNGGIIK